MREQRMTWTDEGVYGPAKTLASWEGFKCRVSFRRHGGGSRGGASNHRCTRESRALQAVSKAEVGFHICCSETDFCPFAVLMAAQKEASIWASSVPIAARNTARSPVQFGTPKALEC